MIFNQTIKLNVKDIMSTDFLKVSPTDALIHVCKKMIVNNRQEAFIVLEDEKEKILGIITFRDIGQILRDGRDVNKPVRQYMTSPVHASTQEQTAKEVRDFMVKNNIGRLPVLDGEKIIGVVDSISLRDNYYAQIEELCNHLQKVIDQLHEGVCVIDSNKIVKLWNKSAENIYQVSAKEILGQKLNDYFPNALLSKVIEKKKPIENINHSPREGSYVAISAKPIFFGDQLIGAVSSERDITEVTELYNELEKVNTRVKLLETEYKKVVKDQYQFGEKIVGKNKEFTDTIRLAQQISKTDVNVLITGESGTGKEVFARGIHLDSGRKGSFIAVNCSAIPSNLLESELFGYASGAFTGALTKGKKGKFQLADGGTLFLDEIGEMPIDMQAKLLRALQDGEIQPIGGEESIKVNARIIAATNRDLEQMMEEGLFREDLYYRLNVISIKIPPLRDRKEDISLLIDRFISEYSEMYQKKITKIPPEVLQILTDYEWPGNIRELKNTIERLVVLSNNGIISKKLLPTEILRNVNHISEKQTEYDLEKVLEDTEIKIIRKVMESTGWNKKKAAEILNIPRSTLYYKLEKYKMEQ